MLSVELFSTYLVFLSSLFSGLNSITYSFATKRNRNTSRHRAIQVYTPEGDAPLSLYATVLSSFFRHHWRLTTSRNLGFPSKLLFRWPSSNFFEKILKVRDFVPQVGFFRLLAPRTGALTHRFAVVCRPIELEVKNRYVCSSEIAGFPCNASRGRVDAHCKKPLGHVCGCTLQKAPRARRRKGS